MQAAEPTAVLYLEMEHAEHCAPSAPVYPSLHTQRFKAVLPAIDMVFPGQLKQVASEIAPMVVEYLPATHLKQVVLSTAMLVVEYWPARQLMQVLATVAPCVPEYLPAPQAVQARLPVLGLKVPAPQGRHGPLLGPLYPTLHKQLL